MAKSKHIHAYKAPDGQLFEEIEKVSCFKTPDGGIFYEQADAERHMVKTDLADQWDVFTAYETTNQDEFFEYLFDNYTLTPKGDK